jgi:ABC-type multidrug transport system ATPase subunit
VCSIHQPSSRLFQMFDDLYVLAEGQCLYNGTINDMTSVFEESGFKCPKYYNRADFGEYFCQKVYHDLYFNPICNPSRRKLLNIKSTHVYFNSSIVTTGFLEMFFNN